jgi:NAD(P)-dependent dehydrogenase (short-subunit alcohol dehydrogenase family)
MAVILITGANRGIGLEMARQYVYRGDELIAVCRQSSPELNALGATVIEGLDVTSDQSLAELARKIEGMRLDRLVNNAGILERDSLENPGFEAVERQFQVNSMGPLRITTALRGNLGNGSKVFIITSRMGSIEDNTSGGYYGYRMSKAAVNMVAKSLSVDLKDTGIGVFLLHPGYVSTDMTGHQGIPVQQCAAGLIERMDTLDIEQTGTFWHQEGYPLPW